MSALAAAPRSATVERATKETRITARLSLGGSGMYDVQTGNKFLTHMAETWTRYAGFDLHLRADGDLDHHLVEDTAIVLGQAFRAAFAQSPCVRIAYDFVPMDDALVLCAVDLVDRPFYAGELPIPLWEHFFRSFAMEARINLHLEVLRGRDTHHTTEAAVKAFARALRRALEPRSREISTKGEVAARVQAPRAETPPHGRPTATSAPVPPLSIEEQEMLAAVERDPAEEGWSWRKGVQEHGVRKAVKDPDKGVLEVRHVAKDGRPRLEAKGRRKKAPADPGTVVAPPLPPRHDSGPLPEEAREEAGAAPAKPESLAAASRQVRSRVHKGELPEVKAARERDREIHGKPEGKP